jgi:predicted dehydrogenase
MATKALSRIVLIFRAVWTRFHPIAYDIQQLVHSGKLGKVKRFIADNSLDFKPDSEAFSGV